MISPPRPRVLWLAVAGLLLGALLGIGVANGLTLGIDLAIIRAVRDPNLVAPLGFLEPITQLGGTPVITAVAAAVFVVEVLAARPRRGVVAALTIALVALLNGGIKRVVDRARPDLLPPILAEAGYSFPSGHSASSMVAYGVVAVLLSRHRGLPAWARSVGVLALGVLVGLVGLSRIYLGVHFPSDVLGGWLLGGVIVLLFAELTRSVNGEPADGERVDRERVSPASTSPGGGAAGADPGAPRSDRPGDR